MLLTVKKLYATAKLPVRLNPTDAGAVLFSAHNYVVHPRSRTTVKTGLTIKLPAETCGRIAPIAFPIYRGIDTGANILDEGFRNELCVVMFNHSDEEYVIEEGDPVAQLIVEPISIPKIVEVKTLPLAERTAVSNIVQF